MEIKENCFPKKPNQFCNLAICCGLLLIHVLIQKLYSSKMTNDGFWAFKENIFFFFLFNDGNHQLSFEEMEEKEMFLVSCISKLWKNMSF